MPLKLSKTGPLARVNGPAACAAGLALVGFATTVGAGLVAGVTPETIARRAALAALVMAVVGGILGWVGTRLAAPAPDLGAASKAGEPEDAEGERRETAAASEESDRDSDSESDPGAGSDRVGETVGERGAGA